MVRISEKCQDREEGRIDIINFYWRAGGAQLVDEHAPLSRHLSIDFIETRQHSEKGPAPLRDGQAAPERLAVNPVRQALQHLNTQKFIPGILIILYNLALPVFFDQVFINLS